MSIPSLGTYVSVHLIYFLVTFMIRPEIGPISRPTSATTYLTNCYVIGTADNV